MAKRSRSEENSWLREAQIRSSISSMEGIFQSGIFEMSKFRSPLYEAAIVQIFICLNDVLQKLDDDGRRVNFVEDVDLSHLKDGGGDITDLVNKCRNAACHMDSREHAVENMSVRFCVVYGKTIIIDTPKFKMTSDYHDDVAICYGKLRIYLNHHLFRALQEAKAALGLER